MRQTALTVDDLRGERLKARVKQQAVADDLGMSRPALSNIENGATGRPVTSEFADRYLAAVKRIATAQRDQRAIEEAK